VFFFITYYGDSSGSTSILTTLGPWPTATRLSLLLAGDCFIIGATLFIEKLAGMNEGWIFLELFFFYGSMLLTVSSS
jgi:hypothetical protein